MQTYLVIIGKTPTGYSAHCPDVQGCAATGETVEKVLANMKRALGLHFEGMVEDGDPIPKPGGAASYRAAMKDLDLETCFLGHVQMDTDRYSLTQSRGLMNS